MQVGSGRPGGWGPGTRMAQVARGVSEFVSVVCTVSVSGGGEGP